MQLKGIVKCEYILRPNGEERREIMNKIPLHTHTHSTCINIRPETTMYKNVYGKMCTMSNTCTHSTLLNIHTQSDNYCKGTCDILVTGYAAVYSRVLVCIDEYKWQTNG